jgi:hypothetical protein
MTQDEERMSEWETPVHDWFGLTYASYLVLPRSVMQSMPVEWQRRMVALLEEADEQLGRHYGENEYDVRLVKDGRRVADPLADYRHRRLERK